MSKGDQKPLPRSRQKSNQCLWCRFINQSCTEGTFLISLLRLYLKVILFVILPFLNISLQNMSSTTPQHLVSAAAETLATLTSSNSGPNDGSCGASLLPSNTSSSNFSAVSDHTYASSIEDSQKVAALSRGTTISNTQSFFPLKLHEIISDERNFDIIQWLPSGKAFIIVDKKRFAKEILPRFFTQQCKFTSFTRKLTRWRFNRVPRGPLIGAYYHELFLRDQKNLVSRYVKNFI